MMLHSEQTAARHIPIFRPFVLFGGTRIVPFNTRSILECIVLAGGSFPPALGAIAELKGSFILSFLKRRADDVYPTSSARRFTPITYDLKGLNMEHGVKVPSVRLAAEQLRLLARILFNAPMLSLLPGDGDLVADHLSDADLAGCPGHGIQRAKRYCDGVLGGHIRPRLRPEVTFRHSCNARVAALHTLGRLAMEFVVNTALELGEQHGSANVLTVTNHIGRMAPYLARIAEAGYIVQCQVNAVGAPTTSVLTKGPRLGTNPIGFAVPNPCGRPFVLDFTPAAATEGKIRVYQAAGVQAPEGLMLDRFGAPTRDPNVIYGRLFEELGSLLPFGGVRSHPMAHLMTVIEMAVGGLTGNLSADARPETPVRGVNAVLLTMVHPERAFGVSSQIFADNVKKTASFIKQSSPLDPKYADDDGTVLLPGEHDEKMRRAAEIQGVILGENVWKELGQVARLLEVQVEHIQPLEYFDA